MRGLATTGCGACGVCVARTDAAGAAFCIEIGDNEYVTYEENKPTPPFVMNCWDEGNGTFIPGVHPITPAPIPSPSCAAPPPGCDLNW